MRFPLWRMLAHHGEVFCKTHCAIALATFNAVLSRNGILFSQRLERGECAVQSHIDIKGRAL